MKRFTDHKEPWGEFLDIKINAPEVLEKELHKQPEKKTVLLSSVTDPYEPVEKKYKITRAILKVLLKYDFPTSILTKSDLVLRDMDLLKQFSRCSVGITITTVDKAIAMDFEPHSPSPQRRLQALEILYRNGIKTYAFIGPILPYLTDLKSIFEVINGKVDFLMAESLNMKCGNQKNIFEVLNRRYPHLVSIYKKGFNKKFWEKTKEYLNRLSIDSHIFLKGFFIH